jgi:hypothetical protein
MQADGNGRTQLTRAGDEGRATPARRRFTPIVLGGFVVLILLAGAGYLFTERDVGVPQPADEQTTQSTSAPTPTPQPSPQPPPHAQAAPPAPPAASSAATPAPPSAPAPSSAATPAPSSAAKAQEAISPTGEAQPAPGTPGERVPPTASQSINQEPAALPNADMKVVQATRANMRSAPRLRAPVLGTVAQGSQVRVIGRAGRWVQVETQGRTGWINAKLLGARASAQ